MAIATIVLVGLVVLFAGLTDNSARTIKTADQIRNNTAALGSIENDMRLTQTFLVKNTLSDTNDSTSPAQPDGWVFRGTGAQGRILILQTYATTSTSQADERQIVYRDNGLGGCPLGTQPVYNNIIYFLKNETLYRRVLVESSVPPSTQYCGSAPTDPMATIGQKQTCSNGQSSGMPSNCREKDVVVASGVTRFDVQYYQQPGDNNVDASVYTMDTPDATAALGSASSLRIDLTTKGEPAANITDISSYRRISKGATRVF